MNAQAKLKFARISSKKMQPIAKAIRGKPLEVAIATLAFMPKKGALYLKKVVESARANAKERQMDIDNLVIKTVQVDKGPMMYRVMTRQRGMAHRMRRRSVHITVSLSDEA